MSKSLDSKRYSRADQLPPKPTSPTSKLSPEERRRLYSEIRSKMGRGTLDIKCPEGIRAVWAMFKGDYGENEMSRLDYMGFKIVKEDMTMGPDGKTLAKPRRFAAAGLRADGTYTVGDVILMEIEEEVFVLMKEVEVDVFEEMRRGIPAEFRDKAEKQGSPTFEVDDNNKPKTVTLTKS